MPRSPRARAVFERFELLPTTPRPLVRQVASARHKVIRLSLPNGWLARDQPPQPGAAAAPVRA